MSTKAAASNLGQILKEYLIQWQDTRNYWRDAKSAEFEHKYLEKLPGYVQITRNVMDEMDTLLSKLKRDCE
ncbi:hypothetical protein DES53_11184 [Roseimicrobium gellanilyticum]|uniref:Uncharacterized protein n=1 Tax=Roseimicrobium gellanilyticum TaxID=748857 RepID=A0A366HA58_9BACT|nr:hypothetical protein [Roseimicrobium gellanilyticum]RBP38566.1 hypothetical protein DES53_11184 [Roseimicrobium gellanilyticum]